MIKEEFKKSFSNDEFYLPMIKTLPHTNFFFNIHIITHSEIIHSEKWILSFKLITAATFQETLPCDMPFLSVSRLSNGCTNNKQGGIQRNLYFRTNAKDKHIYKIIMIAF